ncbi:MAG: hypothetical protein NC343_01415 [Muribaculum sp.]|nr:hypothetical protein [Muribaculaceae bacterium]MCM1080395.1 hypothetical protein [Muribaculum sp.]
MPNHGTLVSRKAEFTYPLRHLLFATFLTPIEVFQISNRQERAPSKRFPLCLADPPAMPETEPLQCGQQLQKY